MSVRVVRVGADGVAFVPHAEVDSGRGTAGAEAARESASTAPGSRNPVRRALEAAQLTTASREMRAEPFVGGGEAEGDLCDALNVFAGAVLRHALNLSEAEVALLAEAPEAPSVVLCGMARVGTEGDLSPTDTIREQSERLRSWVDLNAARAQVWIACARGGAAALRPVVPPRWRVLELGELRDAVALAADAWLWVLARRGLDEAEARAEQALVELAATIQARYPPAAELHPLDVARMETTTARWRIDRGPEPLRLSDGCSVFAVNQHLLLLKRPEGSWVVRGIGEAAPEPRVHLPDDVRALDVAPDLDGAWILFATPAKAVIVSFPGGDVVMEVPLPPHHHVAAIRRPVGWDLFVVDREGMLQRLRASEPDPGERTAFTPLLEPAPTTCLPLRWGVLLGSPGGWWHSTGRPDDQRRVRVPDELVPVLTQALSAWESATNLDGVSFVSLVGSGRITTVELHAPWGDGDWSLRHRRHDPSRGLGPSRPPRGVPSSRLGQRLLAAWNGTAPADPLGCLAAALANVPSENAENIFDSVFAALEMPSNRTRPSQDLTTRAGILLAAHQARERRVDERVKLVADRLLR